MSFRARYDKLLLPVFLPLVLLIFTASGFAGLIYQSIWSHYIKLFLGHAAYAQSLVLAIFMGGMALGAWLASRWSPRWRDLLLAYAVVEAIIGVASLAFHEVFVLATTFAFDTAIPALGSPAAIDAFKWALATALILPQSILLGMTFPLITGGVLRLQPARSGYAIAMLYFTNSLGAAVGVLASGFYLIGAAGLPGTLAAAAVVNLGVAAAAMLLPRGAAAQAQPAPGQPAVHVAPQLRLLLAVSALTGLSSFMYEIGWVRMLSLVLGSSTHAFELMLSAFILGLAFGGLWVRRRIDSARDTVRLLGLVQLAMGIAALLTVPVYGSTFRVMQAALAALSRSEQGYLAFNFVSHGLSLAVMFPPAFCAGMTLPLITASLLRLGTGERAIGQVYAANTLGAIAGVLLAVHAGLPWLGVKGTVVAGAAIDLALGVALLWLVGGAAGRRAGLLGAAASAAGVLFIAAGVTLNAHDMASGVYRSGRLMDPAAQTIMSHEDGKTATVSVTATKDGYRSLRTNGKPDGAAWVTKQDAPGADELTMGLLGALPLAYAPQARHFANIGFGTGITAHVLLASPQLESLDIVEIEPAIVRGARAFHPLNARAFSDARSRVHIEDAKTFFSSGKRRYDVIVSEPSNPWVSGVASLFSQEFYRRARQHLNPGGLFVQWLQVYEISPLLLASVVEALDPYFSDYDLWFSNTGDMIIVAANGGRLPAPDARVLEYPQLQAELHRLEVRSVDDLLRHRMAGKEAMAPYFRSFGALPNSDFFPVLDLGAARARFLGSSATDIWHVADLPVPLLRLFDGERLPDPAGLSDGERPWLRQAHAYRHAAAAARYLMAKDSRALETLPVALAIDLVALREGLVECRFNVPENALRLQLTNLAGVVNPYLPAAMRAQVWDRMRGSPCNARLSPSVRRWLELHAALGASTPAAIEEAAVAILDHEAPLPPELKAYALASGMAGCVLAGRHQQAMRLFNAHRRGLSEARTWQEPFRFLVSHAVPALAPAAH